MNETKLGPYIVQDLIGEGGMGRVFRALHVPLNRPVALKVLHAGSPSVDARRRFLREMHLLADLSHPGLVRIYDGGSIDDVDYYAMELLTGQTLLERLQAEGTLSWEEATRIVLELTHGLGYLHRHDVHHRDLKPSNIMLVPDGTTKLLDFGLARNVDATVLTLPNCPLGTFGFIAPELLCGDNASAASDLWALGAVYHVALLGRLPFSIAEPASWLPRVLNEPVKPPHEVRADIPLEVSRMIVDLLRPEPGSRPPSMAALAKRLAAALAAGSEIEPQGTRPLEVLSPEIGAVTPPSGESTGPRPRLSRRSLAPTPMPVPARPARPWAAIAVAALVAGVALVARWSSRAPVTQAVATPAATAAAPDRERDEVRASDARFRKAALKLLEDPRRPLTAVVTDLVRLRARPADRAEALRIVDRFARLHGVDRARLVEAIPRWFKDPALTAEDRRRVYQGLARLSEVDAAAELIGIEDLLGVAGLAALYAPLRRDAPEASGAFRPLPQLPEPAVRSLLAESHLPVMSHRLNTGLGGFLGMFHTSFLEVVDVLTISDPGDSTHLRGIWMRAGRLPGEFARDRGVRIIVRLTNMAPEHVMMLRCGPRATAWFRGRRSDFRGFLTPGMVHSRSTLAAASCRLALDLPAEFFDPGELDLALRMECFNSREGGVDTAPQMGWVCDLEFEPR